MRGQAANRRPSSDKRNKYEGWYPTRQGSIYTDEFDDGLAHGGGFIYEGEFDHGLAHGRGTLTWGLGHEDTIYWGRVYCLKGHVQFTIQGFGEIFKERSLTHVIPISWLQDSRDVLNLLNVSGLHRRMIPFHRIPTSVMYQPRVIRSLFQKGFRKLNGQLIWDTFEKSSIVDIIKHAPDFWAWLRSKKKSADEDRDNDKAWFNEHEGLAHVPSYPGWHQMCVWDASGNRKVVSKLDKDDMRLERSFEMWVALARLDLARFMKQFSGLCEDIIIMVADFISPSFHRVMVGGQSYTPGIKRSL